MNSLYHNEDINTKFGITKMLLKLCLDATQNVSVITRLFVWCTPKSKILLIFTKLNNVQFMIRGLDITVSDFICESLGGSNKKQK